MTTPSADDARPATAGRASAPGPEPSASQQPDAPAPSTPEPENPAEVPTQAPSNGDQPLLRLVDIGKSFGPVRVLTKITLDIPIGQVTAVVGDNGAGTLNTRLIDTEEFIGLVNQLDQGGFHPKVNHVWKPEFGPGYLTTNHDQRQIQLYTWTPASPSKPGYVGRAGDIAAVVLTYSGQPVPK